MDEDDIHTFLEAAKKTPYQALNNNSLEPTVRALGQLSPQSQETVISLVGQLARESDNLDAVSPLTY